MARYRHYGRFAFFVASSAFFSERARAAEGEDRCFAAAVDGQRERQAGHLLKARENFSVCAQATCDEKVIQRCVAWLAETNAAAPTLAFSAQDGSGRDLPDLRVKIDDVAVASPPGTSVPTDPGPHTIRFLVPGRAPIDKAIVVREGEKGRGVAVVFPNLEGVAAKRPVPSMVYVLGGLGVVLAGVSTSFAVSGLNERSTAGCAEACTHENATRVSTKLVVADVAGGAAILALGAAGWFYFTRPTKTDVAVGVHPAMGGGVLDVRARF